MAANARPRGREAETWAREAPLRVSVANLLLRRPLGLVNGPLIMKFHHFPSCDQTCSSVDLRIHDVECPELLGKLSLVPELCSFAILRNSDVWIRSTLRLKHVLAINSFAPNVPCYPTVRIITLRAELL